MWTRLDFVSRIDGICESRDVTWNNSLEVECMLDPFSSGEKDLTRVCAFDNGLIWVYRESDGNWTLEYDLSSQERSLVYKELWYAFDKANPQQWVGQ